MSSMQWALMAMLSESLELLSIFGIYFVSLEF